MSRAPYHGLPPHVAGSETSAVAAEGIAPTAATLRERVYAHLAALAECGLGATDIELQEALGMDGNTERPRRRELELAGRVRDGGRRRRTRSGRQAVVWVAVVDAPLVQGDLLAGVGA